jgi:L-ascorbate metabolism protein UlaG (beta-lactamase superfamily)
MQIEFVNHASVVVRTGSVRLLCDPWLSGTAFDDGWALLSDSRFEAGDFADITHLWFSHEHPDHFSPAALRAIPPGVRAGITVLFHQSNDRKVLNFCSDLGFGELLELGDRTPTALSDDVSMICGRHDQDDSWMLLTTPDCTVLNLNDCGVNTAEEATQLKKITGPVDVLLTQFSVSSWDGGPDDLPRRKAGAQAMLDRAAMQTRIFSADYLIPFASFIWFCHEENDYMNEALADVREMYEYFLAQTDATPIVMYPGDVWQVGQESQTRSAIEHYAVDQQSIADRPRIKAAPVPVEVLVEKAARFVDAIRSDTPALRFRLRELKMNFRQLLRTKGRSDSWVRALANFIRLRVRPARIWLSDQDMSLDFSVSHGLARADRKREDCDIELSSAALLGAFQFLWGGETLQINGRFRELYDDGRMPLFEYLWIACAMNREAEATARPL